MSDYLDKLSKLVAQTRYDDLSPDAVSAVKDVVLDTVGAVVAGGRLEENAELAKLVNQRSGPQSATILGMGLKAEPMMATLVNATAGVALEMDEGNRFGGGHPAIHTLPGALAVAEEMGASGKQLIESAILSYEIESRIGGATQVRQNVHSHGHWGTIGTAVGVAKLRDYDASKVRAVINLAASMSPANTWTTAFEGVTIRNLYPGRSGFQGILACHLYECGFTGLDDAPSDVFGTILGDSFDPQKALDGLGGEFRIQQNYFKFHACCRYNHPSLDAVLNAFDGETPHPEDVGSIEITVPAMLEGMLGSYPKTMLAAKFNVPFAVAATVTRGKADISAFYPDAIDDDRIRELTENVRIKIDPGAFEEGDFRSQAKAVVRLKDGRVLDGHTNLVRGDYGNRVPRTELLDKFHFLTDDVLGADRANAVIAAVDDLDSIGDVRDLTALL